MTLINHRPETYILTSLALMLAACNGQLDVLEAGIGGSEQGGSGGDGGTSVQQGGGNQGGSGGSDDPSACDDGVRNGNETDIDCGGACAACPAPSACSSHEDCGTKVCRNLVCQNAACDDGIQNGDEQGVDCGGACQSADATARCALQLSTCNCASSPSLMPIACGGRADVRGFLSADASFAAFDLLGDDGGVDTFRWTQGAGAERLPGGVVVGMSADGTRVLMASSNDSESGPRRLWRSDGSTSNAGRTAVALSEDGETILEHIVFQEGFLTRSSGETQLWPAIFGQPISVHYPNAMTPDASVVVGQNTLVDGQERTTEAIRWTSEGIAPLGPRPDGISGAEAMAVNRAGTVVAGFTFDAMVSQDDRIGVFRWTAESGMVVIAPGVAGYLLADFSPIYRLWLSDDGSAVIGTSGAGDDRTTHRAFRWTEASGTVLLDETRQTVVRAIDASGSVIAGYVLNGSDVGDAFVWSESAGFRLLADAFAERRVDMSGWQLTAPLAVSADGQVILGAGTCDGVPSVYRATLSD